MRSLMPRTAWLAASTGASCRTGTWTWSCRYLTWPSRRWPARRRNEPSGCSPLKRTVEVRAAMQMRHRTPTIFNLSMVDVLCCALGCVILLWLLNLREAKQHEDTAGEQARRSASLLAEARADRDSTYALLVDLKGQIAALEEDRARVRGQVEKQT